MDQQHAGVDRHLGTLQQGERSWDVWPGSSVAISFPPGVSIGTIARRAEALVERHESLRMRLGHGPEGAICEVSPPGPIAWESGGGRWRAVVDASGATLDISPREAGCHRLVVTVPPGLVDLGGLAVAATEVAQEPSEHTEEAPIRCGQYAAWQHEGRRTVCSPADGCLPAPSVPTGLLFDEGTTDGALTHRSWRLERRVGWGAVRQAAACCEQDVADVVLAAWLVALWRFNGDRPIDIGVLVDDRDRFPELAATIGVLSRRMPLRFDAEGLTLREAVVSAAERRRALHEAEGFSWTDVPLAVHSIDPRAPAAPITLACIGVGAGLVDRVDLAEADLGDRLSLTVMSDGDQARLVVAHRRDLVDPVIGAGLADAVVSILDESPVHLDTPVSELPLLAAAAAGSVLAASGRPPDTAAAWSMSPIEQLVEQIERTPDRLAVEDGADGCTYAELRWRTTELAARLTGGGIGAGDRVVVLVPRCTDMVTAVLACWWIGAVAVPIDPTTPWGRAAAVVADSGARAQLVHPALAGLAVDEGPSVIGWSSDRAVGLGTEHDGGPPPHRSRADEAASVIYTSGTTGRPKGVIIEHGAIANLAAAHQARIYARHLPEGRGLRAGFGTSIAFDGAIERTLLLLSGATLFVFDDEARRDPLVYLHLMRERRLEVLDVTPTFLSELVRHGLLDPSQHQPTLVLVGGEAIGATLWQRLATSSVEFHNVYGPTEATVNATTTSVRGRRPHVGRALPGVRVRVLDPALQSVPVGVAGEVHISGRQVAAGYVGDPDLTASRFGPDPEDGGWRRYRTGDRGRFLPDGSLELLGRLDAQVSLGGIRIEPEEVASRLRAEPKVEDAVVVLKGQGREARLVAYVLAQVDEPAELGRTLRSRLAAHLPGPAVPRPVIVLGRFPRTANGKVDRQALSEVGRASIPSRTGRPASATEETVGRLWERILNTDPPDVEGDFFELGGDSLSAMALVGDINETWEVELSVAEVFRRPTIEQMALLLDTGPVGRRPEDDASRTVVTAQPGPVPLSPSQEAQLLMAPHDSGGGYLSWVVQYNGSLDEGALAEAVDDVVERHEVLRARMRAAADGWSQEVGELEPGCLRVVDGRSGSKADAISAAVAEAQTTFASLRIGRDTALRATLHRITPKTHVLALFVSDALVDGDSGTLMAEELADAYTHLAGLPAAVERRRAASESFLDHVAAHPVSPTSRDRAEAHWVEQASRIPTQIEWPVATVGQPSPSMGFDLSATTWRSLVESARSMRTTPYVAIGTALEQALASVVEAQPVLITTVVADRRDRTTRRMIGCFSSVVRIEGAVASVARPEVAMERFADAVGKAVAACAVPAPLALARRADELGDGGALSTDVHLYVMERRESPLLPGVRRRRFRVSSAPREPLRVNCAPEKDGSQRFRLSTDRLVPEALECVSAAFEGALQHLAQAP